MLLGGLIYGVLTLLMMTAVLLIATKVTNNPIPPPRLIFIALATAVLAVAPVFGPLLAIVLLGLLLCLLGEMDFWPDALIILAISLPLLWLLQRLTIKILQMVFLQ